MSPSQLTRASGWATALAGAFFILAEVLTPIKLLMHPDALSRVVLTDRFVVHSMLTFIAAMLLLAGLVGLDAFQAREAGRLGAFQLRAHRPQLVVVRRRHPTGARLPAGSLLDFMVGAVVAMVPFPLAKLPFYAAVGWKGLRLLRARDVAVGSRSRSEARR